ncbi:hypothetical protein ACWCSH_49275, partial [Streptosporangium sp. NPDC001682]
MTEDERARELTPPSAPALRLRGISKSYGPVVACDAVDLAVHQGEIHARVRVERAGTLTHNKLKLWLRHPGGGA